MANVVQKTLTGTRKAAILVLTLGDEASSELFKHLHEDEVERIAKEVAAIGAVAIETADRVLEEFQQLARDSNVVTRGGVDHARRLLQRSFGEEAAAVILARVMRSFSTTAGFATLEKTDPQQLSKFMMAEHPQTIALILAHLNSGNAAQLVSLLPDALRSDVLSRMANLEEISPEVVNRISSVIEQRLKNVAGTSREQHGGVRAVAELCNRLDRSVSQAVLDTIENGSPDLAVAIRNLMFVFDDLQHVEDSGLREIIKRVDKKILAIALKGASTDIRSRFLSNMSKRAADMLREEIDVMGAIRLREVEKAQTEVVAVTRRLEEEGLLVTGTTAGEAYVV